MKGTRFKWCCHVFVFPVLLPAYFTYPAHVQRCHENTKQLMQHGWIHLQEFPPFLLAKPPCSPHSAATNLWDEHSLHNVFQSQIYMQDTEAFYRELAPMVAMRYNPFCCHSQMSWQSGKRVQLWVVVVACKVWQSHSHRKMVATSSRCRRCASASTRRRNYQNSTRVDGFSA